MTYFDITFYRLFYDFKIPFFII